MVSDTDAYQPIAPFSDWLETSFNDVQLTIAHRQFKEQFDDATPEIREALIRQVQRESAAESGALENLYVLRPGESRTVAIEADGWEEVFDEQDGGTTVRQAFEDVVAALEYAEEAVLEGRPITLSIIRDIHNIACKSQAELDSVIQIGGQERRVKRPFLHGEFKSNENYVRTRSGKVHRYCPPDMVIAEIVRLCEQIELAEFKDAPAVLQAAYVHFSLAQIHPFDDGNGRVCRVLASLFLLRGYQVPLVVYADRKHVYLQGLEAVHDGDLGPFVQDTVDRVSATLSELAQIISARSRPQPEQRLGELLGLIGRHDAVEFADASQILVSLKRAFFEKVDKSLDKLVSASEGSLSYRTAGGTGNYISTGYTSSDVEGGLPHSFANTSEGRELLLVVEGHLMDLSAVTIIGAGLSSASEERFPFAIVATTDMYPSTTSIIGSVIKLRYEDCFPTISTSSISRMETLADAVCSDMLERLQQSVSVRLRETGRYLD
ncbi:Fic family protein [Nocardia sp. NPDC127606]|uniref:Fic family protein n=1 Tax=Nocardia sp. NPDC127606 TaxID=3345406 RepID=UPI00363D6F3E